MRLISGIVELKPDWFVRVPYPMTEMEFGRYRFGPLAAIPAMVGGAMGGIGTALTGTAAITLPAGVAGPVTGATAGLLGSGGAFGAGSMLGGVAKIAGPLMSILGQQQAGAAGAADIKAQENLYAYKAKVAEQDAEAARQRARFDQMRHAKRMEEVKGLMSARMGAAGAAGSPVALDVKMAQAEELELENLLIGYEGEVSAMRAESQARLDRYQASILKTQRRSAKKGSQFDMFGKILTGFTDIFG